MESFKAKFILILLDILFITFCNTVSSISLGSLAKILTYLVTSIFFMISFQNCNQMLALHLNWFHICKYSKTMREMFHQISKLEEVAGVLIGIVQRWCQLNWPFQVTPWQSCKISFTCLSFQMIIASFGNNKINYLSKLFLPLGLLFRTPPFKLIKFLRLVTFCNSVMRIKSANTCYIFAKIWN